MLWAQKWRFFITFDTHCLCFVRGLFLFSFQELHFHTWTMHRLHLQSDCPIPPFRRSSIRASPNS